MSNCDVLVLGQPPLPPSKKSKMAIFPNFLKSTSSSSSPCEERKPLSRRYSFRKKVGNSSAGNNSSNSDRCSNSSTYRSFGKDIYDGSPPVIFRNVEPYEVKFLKTSNNDDDDSSSLFGSSVAGDFSNSALTTATMNPIRNCISSTNSLFSFSRSHSDSNLSSVCSTTAGDLNIVRYSGAYRNPQAAFARYFRVLGGSWKNLLTLGGMNRPQKIAPQIKKVAPPSVPTDSTYRHSGSSFGSVGYSSSGEDSCFAEVPSKDIYDSNIDCYGMPGRSPNSQFNNYPVFTFPAGPCGSSNNGSGQYMQLHTGKNAVYYHHQLSLQEDQGIDMTQSPGRDSPGSSGSGSGSRHSTASVDSGRASGCHLTTPHSRSSISSSSLGSSSDHNVSGKVERLLMQGVPDQDVLHSWLLDLHFEEYFPLFVSSGYDMNTIIRMTPEDLTAVGIKKPNHRKRLKAEIAQLNISDGLPDYIPGSLNEWLVLLRLEEYEAHLLSQGYETIDDVLQLTWEDLEDTGIVKLGHQKKLLLAIKRIKDLKAGKIFPSPSLNIIQTQACIESTSPCSTVSSVTFSDYENSRLPTANTYRSYYQPWDSEATQHLYYHPTDIVPIKVRSGRGKSLESLKDGSNGQTGASGTSSFHSVPSPQSSAPNWKYRSYDDGDITPTNETVPLHEGAGTLPRPRGLVRPRPIAKIPATFSLAYNNNRDICENDLELKRRPPSPPKRQCESITVVADLHCTDIPPDPAPCSPIWSAEERQLIASLKAQDSDCSFKSSSSSTESESIPFANENAGTIKQRIARSNSEYNTPANDECSNRVNNCNNNDNNNNDGNQLPRNINGHEHALNSSKKSNKQPVDVLDDIGNMLANLTDELDAMLEEEKRQGLNSDD